MPWSSDSLASPEAEGLAVISCLLCCWELSLTELRQGVKFLPIPTISCFSLVNKSVSHAFCVSDIGLCILKTGALWGHLGILMCVTYRIWPHLEIFSLHNWQSRLEWILPSQMNKYVPSLLCPRATENWEWSNVLNWDMSVRRTPQDSVWTVLLGPRECSQAVGLAWVLRHRGLFFW